MGKLSLAGSWDEKLDDPKQKENKVRQKSSQEIRRTSCDDAEWPIIIH